GFLAPPFLASQKWWHFLRVFKPDVRTLVGTSGLKPARILLAIVFWRSSQNKVQWFYMKIILK
ncbi:MAG: hypothetical protein OEV78_13010, partial [Spirochaetia bacterium]|nr:hypothetical protein [Spirochaetia bacterium]